VASGKKKGTTVVCLQVSAILTTRRRLCGEVNTIQHNKAVDPWKRRGQQDMVKMSYRDDWVEKYQKQREKKRAKATSATPKPRKKQGFPFQQH